MHRPLTPSFLASALLIAGCGGTVVFEEDGGGGLGGNGDGGAPSTSGSPTTSSSPTLSGSPTTSGPTTTGPTTSGPTTSGPTTTGPTTSGPTTNVVTVSTGIPDGICGYDVTFLDGSEDECITQGCCAAFDECTDFGADVAGCQACLDGGGGSTCSAALACIEGFECFSGGECFDFGTGDPGLDECLTDNCCVAGLYCTQDGATVDACLQCASEGGGPLCDRILSCLATFCDDPEPDSLCGTDISFKDPDINECVEEAGCCDAVVECTDVGTEECIDCLVDGGGAICDDALECFEASGCVEQPGDDDDGGGGAEG